MPAREDQHIARSRAYTSYNAVGSNAHVSRHLTSRAAVVEQLPSSALRVDILGKASLILTVVPLQKIAIDLVCRREPGQFAGTDRTLQRAGQHPGEGEPAEAFSEVTSIPFALLRQG